MEHISNPNSKFIKTKNCNKYVLAKKYNINFDTYRLCIIIGESDTSYKLLICDKSNSKFCRKKYLTKEFIIYDKPINLECNYRTNTKFMIYCDFCEKQHKYHHLGINSYKCNSNYSPYKKYGVNIIFKYKSFKECLLNNFKEYMRVYSNYYYYNYLVKFIDGNTFGDYGYKHFPYFNTENVINYINKYYKEDNKKMSNGGLTASIKKFVEMMKKNKLYLYNYENSNEYINIKNYYY